MSEWLQQALAAMLSDSYSIKARWLPALIAMAPLLVAIAIPLSLFEITVPAGSLGACLLVAGMYLASQAVRARGVSIQSALWWSWGGPPSTRFVRWRDDRFAYETKRMIHQVVLQRFGIHLLTLPEELARPEDTDLKIDQAFMQVRQVLRNEAGKDVVLNAHNAEYGFLRNLLGARSWMLGLAVVCSLAAAAAYWSEPRRTSVLVCLIELLLAACSILGGWYVMPALLKHSAERYAESAWSCFLQLPSNAAPVR